MKHLSSLLRFGSLWLTAAAFTLFGCSNGRQSTADRGASGQSGTAAVSAGGESGGSGTEALIARPVVISTATRTPRPANWSVDYWMWLPSAGDPVEGTQPEVRALQPAIMRIGGYNSDANWPDPFDDAELDKAVAYAHAIGAEPLVQQPLIADIHGDLPTADEAAAMVTYANVTKHYGLKYFAIGNEPDLYATQGSPQDMSQPAFAGYTPTDYCAAVTAFAKAMKAVDPTIKIVGPQLSYKYQPGNDWLSPILEGCGAEFDIISIQRFPFNSAQASVQNASADALAFRAVIKSVRELMATAGYADKPLAITGMNVAYDAPAPGAVPGAAPGTIGSALWLADIVGTAQELNLWTTVVWDISDGDDESLGLIGMPPLRTLRPEYYAYQLYAEHFGPTLLDVIQSPTGVSAHATRNQEDDATEVIVVNWNAAPEPLGFEVTGLASSPLAPIFELPALSMAAVEIQDNGAASAWVYGEAQHSEGAGPQALAASPGVLAPETDGGDAAAAAPLCVAVAPLGASITSLGMSGSEGPTFGSGSDAWGSFVFAGDGQPTPTMSVTSDGNGFRLVGQLVAPSSNNYDGVGLYFDSPYCADVSAYTGIEFDLSGDLGGCVLAFGSTSAADVSSTSDPARGHCTANPVSSCYGPVAEVTAQLTGIAPDAAVPDSPAPSVNIKVPFSTETTGSPSPTLDPSTLVSLVWRLSAVNNGGACAADLTVENVAFY